MTPRLTLTELERRDTPTAGVGLIDPQYFVAGFNPFGDPGVDVTRIQGVNVDWDGNGTLDDVYSYPLAGSARVVVISGGELGATEDVPGSPGLKEPLHFGQQLASVDLFNDPTYRGGLYVTAVGNGAGRGGPGGLVAGWAADGTSSRVVTYDPATGATSSFFAFDPTVGVTVYATTVRLSPDDQRPTAGNLVVIPLAGGGPVVAMFDTAGSRVTPDILVGPADDRGGGYQIVPAGGDALVSVADQVYGFALRTPDGGIKLVSWTGQVYPDYGGSAFNLP